MSQSKGRKQFLHSFSATPPKAHDRADQVDITQSDPWRSLASRSSEDPFYPASFAQLASSPLSGMEFRKSPGSTTIGVPQDLKANPIWLRQQMTAARRDYNRRPSFYGPIELMDNERSGDDTPTSGQKDGGGMKSNDSKDRKENGHKHQHDEAEEEDRQKKKRRVKKQMEEQTARALKIQAANNLNSTATSISTPKLKRKRSLSEAHALAEAEIFTQRVTLEAHAMKGLRETLPLTRLDRVTRYLTRSQNGTPPTEMAVLLTAARETVLDLAKAQMLHNASTATLLSDEMFHVLRKQNERLAELGETVGVFETFGVPKFPAGPVAIPPVVEKEKEKARTVVREAIENDDEDETSSSGEDDSDDEVEEEKDVPKTVSKAKSSCDTQ